MKHNTEKILQQLMEVANDNGYSIIINGTKDNNLHIVAYPFKGTFCPEEDIARMLNNVLEKNNVMEDEEALDRFKKDAEPDSRKDFIFSGPSDPETHISVFHNKNILLKQIYLKV